MSENEIIIRPQPGPQENFLATEADIAFYGGAAGGGKTYGLLLDPLRHVENPLFRGMIFRREFTMLMKPGGIWDEATGLYTQFGAESSKNYFTFSSGARFQFDHLNEEKDKFNYQGAQLSYIGFDEVTQFSWGQFSYLLSRLRSVSGIRGCIRATCNPDPESWVAEFLEYWIDQNEDSPTYGLPIKERAGKLRWFIRDGENIIWADSKEELTDLFPDEEPLSVTFIPAKVSDNKILLSKDKRYIANLKAMNRVDRGRLLDGNWKIKAVAGELFQRSWFEVVEGVPPNIVKRVRYWDRAATEPSESKPEPDWTVGVRLAKDGNGVFYVEHVERFQGRPLKVREKIKNVASQDGFGVLVGIEQDPGQAGVAEAEDQVRNLAGFIVKKFPVSKDKVTRAKPASAQCEIGNIKIVRGAWNRDFLNELESFPDGKKKDQVDAFSGAFNMIAGKVSVLDAMTKR